jgi:predicted ATPase
MNPSANNVFHSGKRLRQLREMQGLKITELASELAIDYEILMTWEDNGVPAEHIVNIQQHFNVTNDMFEATITSQYELGVLAQAELFPQAHDIELKQNIAANKSSKSPTLHLAGLNLSAIPDEVFSFTWLQTLDCSNNHIEFISAKLLLLPQLQHLDIGYNRIKHLPVFLTQSAKLQQPVSLSNQPEPTGHRYCCIALLEEINHENLQILDELRKTQQETHDIFIGSVDDCEMLLNQCVELSHIIYIGAMQPLLKQLKTIAAVKQKHQPWLWFNDSQNQQLEVQNLADLLSPHSVIHTVTSQSYKEKFAQISHQDQLENIRLTTVELHNIGVYTHLKVAFNAELTVLIGVNGAGKSTVLKAIALGLLGPDKAAAGAKNARDLLRINGKAGKNTLYQPHGKIILSAMINGVEHHNTIDLHYNIDTGMVDIEGSHFGPWVNANGLLNNLVLGISEQRNASTTSQQVVGGDTAAKVRDLLPLLTGEEQSCISHFSSWLGNLALEVLNGDQQKQAVIDHCFKVFSEFMTEPVFFKGFTRADPMELWIEHQNPQQTIPLRLASQGYQAVMGWVGYIIQRMFEAYNDCLQPFNQPGIIIIDEIDQLLSVKWQQQILTVLSKVFFPNTQWIVSSHSPMVVTDLDQAQVIQLHEVGDELVAEANQVDLWMWKYDDIVRNLFEVPSQQPKFQEQELLQSIKIIEAIAIDKRSESEQQTLEKLHTYLAKVQQSRAAVDTLYEQQQNLHQREQELTKLIAQLAAKDQS